MLLLLLLLLLSLLLLLLLLSEKRVFYQCIHVTKRNGMVFLLLTATYSRYLVPVLFLKNEHNDYAFVKYISVFRTYLIFQRVRVRKHLVASKGRRFSVHSFLMIFPDELSAPAAECQKYLCKSNIILVQQYGSTVVFRQINMQ